MKPHIDDLLADVMIASKTQQNAYSKFDKIALSPVRGKLLAIGIVLGFNLMEEVGYLARISFLFDNTMSKVGLQGKTIMPFFMGLGCTIAGATSRETHSVKWTAKIGVFYTVTALLISCIVYHIGLLIF